MRKHLAVLLAVILLAGLLATSPAFSAEKAKAGEVNIGDSVTINDLYPELFAADMYYRFYFQVRMVFYDFYDIQMMNPEGIGRFMFGDGCNFNLKDPNASVTVMAKDRKTKRVLVKYESKEEIGSRRNCPSGTLFFVDKDDFARALGLSKMPQEKVRQIWAAEQKAKKEKQEAERQRVKELLGE